MRTKRLGFKPGSTPEMFGRDSEACLQDARAASPVTQKYGVIKHRGYEFDD